MKALTTARPEPGPGSVRVPEDADDSSIWPYLTVLLRHPWLSIVTPLVLAVSVGTYTLLSPRQYQARASFSLHESQNMRSAMGNLASQLGLQTGSPSSSPQFYADLLQSRGLLYEVATTRYQITDTRRFDGTLVEFLEVRAQDDTNQRNLAAVDVLQRRLAVAIDAKTSIVRFTVRMPSAQLAGAVARRILDLVNDFDVRRRQTQVKSERAFLEKRTEEALQEVRTAQQMETDFYQHNRQASLPPLLRAEELNIQRRLNMAQTTYTTLVQQYELAKVEAVRDTPVITVLDAPERFVERMARQTLLKTLATFLVAMFAGAMLALFRDYLRRAKSSDDTNFQQLVDAWHGVRGSLTRRARETR
jgi:uncharacterized protein involved in exopolysaccharide biosynthesis